MEENVRNRNRPLKTECGYGWVVVGATFFVYLIADGLVYSFGILLVEMLETFKQGTASTVVMGSILYGFMYIIGPLAGALSKMFGCRIIVVAGALISCSGFVISYFATSVLFLCFSYGLLGGIGLRLMFLPAGVCVIQHFSHHRAVANGIACCGTGRCLGLFLLPPKRKQLNSDVHVQVADNPETQAFRRKHVRHKSSEKTCSSCLASSDSTSDDRDVELTAFDTEKTSNMEKSDTDRDRKQEPCLLRIVHLICNRELLSSVTCWAFLLCNFTVQLAHTVPFNLLPDEANEKGINKFQVSWLMSSIGITNTLGRLIFGWLADFKCVNRLLLLETVLILAGLSTAASPLLPTFETKITYPCLYGLFVGGYVVLCPVVLADLFDTELINQSVGLWFFVCGVGGIVASPIGGWLFDMTGSYDVTFIVAGVEFALGGLLLMIPNCLAKAKNKQSKLITILAI